MKNAYSISLELELIELEKEINEFANSIELFFDSDYLNEFKILSIDDFLEDSYHYNEFNNGTIVISRSLLNKRNIGIERFLNDNSVYSRKEILKCMYRHILSHEYYHFMNKNIQRTKRIERQAEKYAIEMLLKEEDRFLVYVSILIETLISNEIILINRKNHDQPDILHMKSSEILKYIFDEKFSLEQRDIIKKIRRDFPLDI